MSALTMGKNITVYSHCFFTHPNLSTVKIGNNVLINHYAFFDNGAAIEIGDRCNIAMSVQFITATHSLGSSEKRAGKLNRKPIRIESGCWICAGVRVLPGVTIGSGCWILSGAEVTKDCESNGVYAGIPAKRIKDLSES
ncbi:acyltransferase [Phormidium sp. FACHB-592]|uniref:Acyltransferase n=1 Tax=Stenomitos frigidus AS-A4 TaxID=2933935 RepID=A0ABV0KPS4_9CYAN|nr:acyltransferase [Phormidium sp. FACHB-592]MBD2072638.1 acyltransferase [Phormidium sp. FACHB-592]